MADSAQIFSAGKLTLRIGQKTLLADFSISLGAGELKAVTGPSGCGKTTLLRTLATLDTPATGKLSLMGKAPAKWGEPNWRRQVVLAGQQPVLLDDTVIANLARPFSYATGKDPFPRSEACRLCAEMGLEEQILQQSAPTLSVGQQQRVALIRALLLRPKVLLLDEPTSALDEEMVGQVEDSIRREAAAIRMGCIIVTHDRRRAEEWCDHVCDLRPFINPENMAAATLAGEEYK